MKASHDKNSKHSIKKLEFRASANNKFNKN